MAEENADEKASQELIRLLEDPNITIDLRKRLAGAMEHVFKGDVAPLLSYLKSTPKIDDQFKQHARKLVVKTLGTLGENGQLGGEERKTISALILTLNDSIVSSAVRESLLKIGAVAPDVTLDVLRSALETKNQALIAVRKDVTEIRNTLTQQTEQRKVARAR